MAFLNDSLVITGQSAPLATGISNSRSLYIYPTNDAAAAVETAGYFNGARGRLGKGDIVLAMMALGGTPVGKAYIVTAAPSSGNITVALFTATAG